jgi:pyruvate dehydrogenase E1 component
MAGSIPNCVSYDPAFNYELAVIVHDGIRRMMTEKENVFFYITVMNENYTHPELPKNTEQGILKGMYQVAKAPKSRKTTPRAQLLGSGTILKEALAAAKLLEADFGVLADVWSVTSYNELARQGQDIERWNRLHPDDPSRTSFVFDQLAECEGPVIAASDYNRAYADQIREFVPRRYVVLGTDGYGRSGTRKQLRNFFEVDRKHIALAALTALVDENAIPKTTLSDAMQRYQIDPEKPNPTLV